jgi:hypothetical protein
LWRRLSLNLYGMGFHQRRTATLTSGNQPRHPSSLQPTVHPCTNAHCHLKMIKEQGRLAWQVSTDYGRRSLIETTMGRYKVLIGPRLRARGFPAQQTEAAIGAAVLNRMLMARGPKSVRRKFVTA